MLILDIGYSWLMFLAFILGRYFLMVGGAVVWLNSPPGRQFLNPYQSRLPGRSPQSQPFCWRLIRHDICLSISAAGLFALLATFGLNAYEAGHTLIYSTIGEYGWGYLGLSFGLTLILHDTYFYFTHRLLHHPLLFKRVHQGHHRSRPPTPWTSFAFTPGEALIQGLFFVALVFLVPLHIGTLIAALMTMTVWAIVTHIGTPLQYHRLSATPRKPFGWFKGLIGPTHHGLHHRHYGVHFGLYFTFWDQLLGTTHPTYGKPGLIANKSDQMNDRA